MWVRYLAGTSDPNSGGAYLAEGKSSRKIILTDHVIFQARRRKIPLDLIEKIVREPEQKLSTRKKRFILQGRYRNQGHKKEMILRVVSMRKKMFEK